MFKHSTLAAVLIILGSGSAVSAKSDTSFLTDAIQINLAEIAVAISHKRMVPATM